MIMKHAFQYNINFRITIKLVFQINLEMQEKKIMDEASNRNVDIIYMKNKPDDR